MNCSEIHEHLSAYYDGELPVDSCQRMAEHLSRCTQCARELAEFELLSSMTSALSTPAPPAEIWRQIEAQLEVRPARRVAARPRRWAVPVGGMIAAALTVLVAAASGWLAWQTWSGQSEPNRFDAEFARYVERFGSDPETAQQSLVRVYKGQAIELQLAEQGLGYRPAMAKGVPQDYSIEATYVMKMPCCTCVQCVCQRADGTRVAIFEHNDEKSEWFGDRPEIKAKCNGRDCRLVEVENRFAATWKSGPRHFTAIGMRDIAELVELVAWLEKRKPITTR